MRDYVYVLYVGLGVDNIMILNNVKMDFNEIIAAAFP